MAGGVEVTPSAMRSGLHRGRADSPARFRFLGQAVGVGGWREGKRTLQFHLDTRGVEFYDFHVKFSSTKFTDEYLEIHKKRNNGSLCSTKGTYIERT